MLQDPKLIPIPVVPKGSTKTFSWSCYLITMIVIGFCITGFIFTIGGIIYLEVVSKNSTNATSASPMDVSNLLQESQSQGTADSIKLNDQSMNQDSRSLTSGKVNVSAETDDPPQTIHILDFGKAIGTELSQYIDNKRTEIRIQKGNAVMYKEKSISSVEYQDSINIAQSSDYQRDITVNNTSTENNKSNQSKNLTDADQKLDETVERFLLPNSSSRENVADRSEEFSSLGKIDNMEGNQTAESTSEASMVSMTTNKLADSSTDQEKLSEHMNAESIEVFRNTDYALANLEIAEDRTERENILNEQVSQSTQKQLTELGVTKDFQLSTEDIHDINSDHSKDSEEMGIREINLNKSNPDVESKLSVDETVRENKNAELLILKRKGDANPTFNPPTTKTTLKIMKNGTLPSTGFSQQFKEDEKPKDVEPKPSLDIKVSLAEAMKHLQALDVNNKLLSSRAKSAKPKVTVTTRRPLRTNTPRKEEPSREKMQYLQKLRLMLYEHLQQ